MSYSKHLNQQKSDKNVKDMNSTCFEVSSLLLLLFSKQLYYEYNLPPPTLKKQNEFKNNSHNVTMFIHNVYFAILNVHASMSVIQIDLATFSQKGL